MDRCDPLRFEEVELFFRAGDFLALLFIELWTLAVLGADFREVSLRAAVFLAEDFFAGDFLAWDFLAEDFLAGDFFADGFPFDDFLCRRSRARAVPPITAPSAAALVAATSNGLSAMTPAAFFPVEPTASAAEPTFAGAEATADAASPTFSFSPVIAGVALSVFSI